MNPHIFIYVWKADDSGLRGTLYAVATSTLEANTTNGSLQTFTFASYTLSSLAISAGDRIVVELMAYDNNTKTVAYNHIIGLNGAVASGYESYIEFSMDLAWNYAACEAYAAEAILDYVAPTEAYAAESILDYVPPTEVYAAETILDYIGLAEVYAAESILDYIAPTETYAAEVVLDYEVNPCEVYATEVVLDYIAPGEIYAAESILDYAIPPCEVYAAEALLDYIIPAEVYATEGILDYEINPTELYAVETILDYISPGEVYAAEAIIDYNLVGTNPCEIYSAEGILDYGVVEDDPAGGGTVTDTITGLSEYPDFNWDSVKPTVPDEDVQTSVSNGAVEKLYTVPDHHVWRITTWRVTCSVVTKVVTVRLYKEAAKTNLIEEWLTIANVAAWNYSSRGLNVANNYGWTEIDLPPGATIAFNYASTVTGETMKSLLTYKDRVC
jgi:hypothetical protein